MSEKNRILQMVRDGKISVDEGLELLGALDETDAKAAQAAAQGPSAKTRDRFLRVRVDSADTKVNVNIPLGLLKVASNLITMGSGFIPQEARREMEAKGIDISKIDFEELVSLIDQGLVDGKLVDVDVDDPKEGRTKVEVYVE
jgi:hypothetical protein